MYQENQFRTFNVWRDGDILIRHALTGQEKKLITKPYIQLPIGSYVKYMKEERK